MTKPNGIDRSTTSKTITQGEHTKRIGVLWVRAVEPQPKQFSMTAGVIRQNLLDGGAKAGNLGSGYTALVCGEKRVNL